jgi:hypothetical protein
MTLFADSFLQSLTLDGTATISALLEVLTSQLNGDLLITQAGQYKATSAVVLSPRVAVREGRPVTLSASPHFLLPSHSRHGN